MICKQRRFGLVLVILGIMSIIPERDATAALFLVPLGVAMMATKKIVIYGEEKKHDGKR